MRIRSSNSGFTLVELLVVFAIIAVLIALLLPVLSSAQSHARDIKCQSNLRQIVQAILGYAVEHDGYMPYGFYWNRSINHMHSQGHPDPFAPANTWAEADDNPGSMGDPDNAHPFISWASLVGRHVSRGGLAYGDNTPANFPAVLQCPEIAMTRPHLVGYVMNIVIGISPESELRMGAPPGAQLKPPVQTQMLAETAIVWDTGIKPNWEDHPGYLISADLDDQRFWRGAEIPQFRYYSIRDPFGRFPGGVFGQNRPLSYNGFYNRDPDPWEGYPYQGNLRFRHRRDTTCNAGFTDGSVRQFNCKMRHDKLVTNHNALRRYFMIKWPQGVSPNYSYAY